MNRIFLSLSLLVLIAGCSTFQKPDPLPTVNRVDMEQVMGSWFVISSMPTVFDRSPFDATVSVDRAEKGIRIQYDFYTAEEAEKKRSVKARAMVDNPGINSDWTVTYAWPFGTDLRVIYLEADYSVMVLGNPDRKKVWVLSRRPALSDPLYSDIIIFLQRLGYDVGEIRKVPQN